jgi:hypothetical protein
MNTGSDYYFYRGGPGFSRFLVPVVQLERITGDRQT